MEYTKGGWEVTRWAGHNDIHVSVNEGSYMGFIANCGNPVADTLPTNPEALANAHLIASAPDLYEALKDWVDWAIDDERTRVMPMGKSDKALAKAKGK